MKKIIICCFLVASVSAFAAENCKPIHESPVTVSVSGKNGKLSVVANDMTLKGNALSPKQPAEQLNFVAGSFAFSLIPISSCQDGLLVEFQNVQTKRQSLVAWGREVAIDGKSGSESYVIVTAHKSKP